MSSKVVLVTGASSGLGLAVIRRLGECGFTVIGCARNISTIEDLSSGHIHAITCDISKEKDVVSMFHQINTRFGGLDICINNAGLGRSHSLLEGSPDAWREMYEVNVIGACIVTQHAVKSMQSKKGDNCIVLNVSGYLAINQPKFTMPNSSFVIATKHALNGVTSALRGELSAQGLADKIRVMQVLPGLIETDFIKRSCGAETARNIYQNTVALKPADVVDCIMHALSTPKRVTITDQVIRSSSSLL